MNEVALAQSSADSGVVILRDDSNERRGAGGFEVAFAHRSDGMNAPFFRAFYEAEIGKTFLSSGAFSYQKINEGFGFDFRLRMPFVFYPEGRKTNFSPLVGMSFTVWPTTVAVGFPIGIEYELLLDHFPNFSFAANIAPQLNLSTEKNRIIFDIRIGIRLD